MSDVEKLLGAILKTSATIAPTAETPEERKQAEVGGILAEFVIKAIQMGALSPKDFEAALLVVRNLATSPAARTHGFLQRIGEEFTR